MQTLKCLANSHPWLYTHMAGFFKSESFIQLLINKIPPATPTNFTTKLLETLKIFPCQGTFDFLKSYLQKSSGMDLHICNLLSEAVTEACWYNPGSNANNAKHLAYFLLKQGYICSANSLERFIKKYLRLK